MLKNINRIFFWGEKDKKKREKSYYIMPVVLFLMCTCSRLDKGQSVIDIISSYIIFGLFLQFFFFLGRGALGEEYLSHKIFLLYGAGILRVGVNCNFLSFVLGI